MNIFDWITFGVALSGFLMSAATWGRDFWMRRNRIGLSVIDYKQYPKTVQFFLLFHNHSSMPASISRISIAENGKWIDCDLEPKRIKTTSSGYEARTPCFPVNLPPTAFAAHYIEFTVSLNSPLVPGKTVAFQIRSSRGTIEKLITLGEQDCYLHKKSQSHMSSCP